MLMKPIDKRLIAKQYICKNNNLARQHQLKFDPKAQNLVMFIIIV